MRIATWNVNSLKARLEKVQWWLDRARPDVLLIQETKLGGRGGAGRDVPRGGATRSPTTARAGGTGVAIASRIGLADVVRNFGDPIRSGRTPDVGDDEPLRRRA
jgi:exodeoxyribonuclease-3